MKMSQCDVCCMNEVEVAFPSADVARDLNFILGPDYACSSLLLCSECSYMATRAAHFIQTARIACSHYSTFHREVKKEDSDGVGINFEDEFVQQSCDKEKPLDTLIVLSHRDVKKEDTNGVDILFEDEFVQQSSDEEKPLETFRIYKEMANSNAEKKQQKKKKHKSNELQVAKKRMDASIEKEHDDLNDVSKPKKDGRRIVETQEYSVMWLSKEQVQAEISERVKSESYLKAPFRCSDCACTFTYEEVYNTHREKHSPKNGTFECDICHQFCPSAVSLRGHMKSHATRYTCKVCGCVKRSRQHLLEHYRLAHAEAGPTETPAYACAQCSYSCQRRTMFQKHVRTHTAHASPCHQCGKMFKTIQTLRAHMLRHTILNKQPQQKAVKSQKELYCVECDARFSNRSSFMNHLRRSRPHRPSQTITYTCDACKKTFSSEASLHAHETWAHEGRREHACEKCTRVYGTRESLRVHVRRAHGAPVPQERRFRCGYCDKMFMTRDILKRHERIHTGERPYECQECDQQFAQRATRNTHIRLVHRKLPRKVRILGL